MHTLFSPTETHAFHSTKVIIPSLIQLLQLTQSPESLDNAHLFLSRPGVGLLGLVIYKSKNDFYMRYDCWRRNKITMMKTYIGNERKRKYCWYGSCWKELAKTPFHGCGVHSLTNCSGRCGLGGTPLSIVPSYLWLCPLGDSSLSISSMAMSDPWALEAASFPQSTACLCKCRDSRILLSVK